MSGESKRFFLEKKNQKTFAEMGQWRLHQQGTDKIKFFCCFFFKKSSACFLQSASAP
jgi:hypothetical protein